jgi:molybdopterin synthase catalytic subunit
LSGWRLIMNRFSLHDIALQPEQLRRLLQDPACGGYAAFEGWVRDCNDGRTVLRLEYEAFGALALREGERILDEAQQRFGVARARCAHRVGPLAIGELAVWVGVSAPHRGEAFDACRYIIDEVKHRVPIWKKEYYQDGDSGWVNCERCAAGASPGHGEPLAHEHATHVQRIASAGAASISRAAPELNVASAGAAVADAGSAVAKGR